MKLIHNVNREKIMNILKLACKQLIKLEIIAIVNGRGLETVVSRGRWERDHGDGDGDGNDPHEVLRLKA